MITVQHIIDLVNGYTGEFTEDRVSNTERMQAISEAVTQFKLAMKSDMSQMTHRIDFTKGLYSYRIPSTI